VVFNSTLPGFEGKYASIFGGKNEITGQNYAAIP